MQEEIQQDTESNDSFDLDNYSLPELDIGAYTLDCGC